MLLDISSYGFVDSLKKGLKVLGYHVFSNAIVAALASVAVDLGKLKVAHPLYAVYLASAIALVNVVTVIVTHWLTTINPDTTGTVVSSDTVSITDSSSNASGLV